MIARKSALIIFIQILNGILGYVGLFFIARYMTPWEYGIVGFAYGFVALFSIFGQLGFDQAHVKRVSEGKNLGRCIGTFVVTKTVLAGILATVTFLSIAVWKYIFGRGFESPLHLQAVYIMLAYFVLLTLSQTMIATFRARKEIAKAQIPLLLYNFIRILTTVLVAFYGFGAIALVYTYLIGEIFQFVFAFFLFRKYPIEKPSLGNFRDYSKFAVPMAIATSCAIIMTNIDKIIIQLFWSAQQLGEYFAVYNLSRYIILFANSVGLLLFPTISEYHSKNNIKMIKELVLKSERYLSMVIFPIVTIMVILAEPIIHILLSDKYMPALHILQVLPLFTLLAVLSRPYESQLVGMNMPNITRNRVIIMVVINVILNLALIPKDIKSIGINLAGLGAMGAAIATVISYFVGLIYVRVAVWRITNVAGNIRILLHALAAGIMGSILWYISSNLIIDRWYELLGLALFGLGLYFGILRLLGEFKKEDFDLFTNSLNIKKMFSYVKDEFKGKNSTRSIVNEVNVDRWPRGSKP